MDERRKIVIPIGGDSESKSEQTFFDTQSRKDARPVVPLSGPPATGPVAPAPRSRKKMFLILFLVAAVAAGASAVAYSFVSRGSGKSGPQAAVQPVAGKTLSVLPWTHTPEDAAAEETSNANVEENTAEANETRAQNDRTSNNTDPKKVARQKKRGKGDKNENDNSNDPVKRTQDELNRIREIFEGPPN